MAATALISVRVPENIAKRLAHLSKSVTRSKSFLAAEAIEEYLDLHEWQVQALQKGLEEVKQNSVVDLEEVKRELGLSFES